MVEGSLHNKKNTFSVDTQQLKNGNLVSFNH
jgi:hypothetical protein